MSMSLGSSNRARAEINITPMIDVLLVLIIIFMVITPLAPLGLRTQVPQNSAVIGSAEPPDQIVITVLPDGSYLLNSEPLAQAALESRLARLFRNGAADVVFVRGGPDIEFRLVAGAIDLARGVGVSRIGLMP